MRALKYILIASGIAGIMSAIIISPEFVQKYISSRDIISPERSEILFNLRLFSFLIGFLLFLSGVLLFRFQERMISVFKHPAGTVFVLIFGWIIMAFLNYMLKQLGLNLGTPVFFPFSEVRFADDLTSGLPYSILYLIVFFIFVKYCRTFNIMHLWIAGLVLIVLGNLAQGGFVEAFHNPVNAPYYYSGALQYQQYFHDAIRITDWHEWLWNFNLNQADLLNHTKTHPPFAILLHYFIYTFSGNSLTALSFTLVFLSSLSIIFIFTMMNTLGLPKDKSMLFALLFSVIPGFNIYSAVSLDGVIVSTAMIYLLGLIMIIKDGRSVTGVALFTAGLLISNLLTFLALFLLATAGLLAVREFFADKKQNISLAIIVFLVVMAVLQVFMDQYFGYNHVQAFITASGLEPKSLFDNLLRYFMTRLENVTMIAIFLSFGIVAVLLRSSLLKLKILDIHDEISSVFIAGLIPVLLFFLIGGLYTGEAARILLFVYPFFLIPLRKIDESILRFLIVSAGIQTIIMQTVGSYYW